MCWFRTDLTLHVQRLYTCMQIVPLHGALGYLASWQFFFEASTTQWIALSGPCIRKTASSCAQPHIPQHTKTDMSHMTHTSLPSCTVRRPASSPSGVYKRKCRYFFSSTKRFRVHRGEERFLPEGTCAQSHTYTPHQTAFCTDLQWLTRASFGVLSIEKTETYHFWVTGANSNSSSPPLMALTSSCILKVCCS